MAAGLGAKTTQESGAAKPQLDLSALVGMASSLLGPALQQQQQQGPRAAGPDLGSLFGSLLAGVGQPPSATPAPASVPAATPDAEENPIATLVQLGIPEDQAAQFLELSGGDATAALTLWQELEAPLD